MVTGVHNDANNIFRNTHGSLSRIHGASGNVGSEADYKALSQKDTKSITDISRDELDYEIRDLMGEQADDWRDENFDRAFSTFSD